MSGSLYGWVAGISTLFSMIAFIGVVAWCYSARRRSEYAAAAQMPLEEDDGVTRGAQP
jgi:cbb3-type cytochrome oxidase subunit 3